MTNKTVDTDPTVKLYIFTGKKTLEQQNCKNHKDQQAGRIQIWWW